MKNYVKRYFERLAVLRQRNPEAAAAKERSQAEARAASDKLFVNRSQAKVETVDPIRAAIIARLAAVDINTL